MSEDVLTAIFRAVDQITPAVKGIEANVSKAMGTIKTALVGAFTVAAVKSMISDTLDLTGRLTDLAGKTGMTTTALQVLGTVTASSGVSLEMIARGATTLAKNLIGDNKGAVAGVTALGLNTKALIEMAPDQAFLKIGEAIAKVPNPMERSALATAIFGKAGADYLPAFTTDMTALGQAVLTSGNYLSEDLVKAGDDAGDALGALSLKMEVMKGKVILPLIPGLTALANWFGDAIPRAMELARGALDGVTRAGLAFQAWMAELAVSVAQGVRDVPVLGRVFGQSAADINTLKESAQLAKDTLSAFDQQAQRPATEAVKAGSVAMQAAIPTTTSFSQAHDTATASVKKTKDAVVATTKAVAEKTGMQERSIAETGRLTQALERWAYVNGAVLAPSIREVNSAVGEQEVLVSSMEPIWAALPGAVQQHTTTASGGIMSFFSGIFGGAQGLAGSLTRLFSDAFTGGGGALGAVKAFATEGIAALMNMIPLIGPFISGLAGPIVAGLTAIGKKIGGFFRDLFGGPSGDELAGRELVAKFEANLHKMLDGMGKLEPGMESWEATVVAIRDAYIAQGRTEQEALNDAARLWASSKKGAEESARVIAEIERKMKTVGDAAKDAIDGIDDAIDGLPHEREINIRVRYHKEGEGYEEETGSGSVMAGGSFTAGLLGGMGAAAVSRGAGVVAVAGGGQSAALAELLKLQRDLPRQIRLAMRQGLVMG